MTQANVYDLLALLNQRLCESVSVLKRLTTCPGQRSSELSALGTEIEYVRAQANFEVTTQASEDEEANMSHWGWKHRKREKSIKDPDDVFFEAEQRDKERQKMGLPRRIVVLPWSYEEEEKLLAARRAARKRPKAKRPTKQKPNNASAMRPKNRG